jgi:hypothetical protein
MSTEVSSKRPLTELNHLIEQLEADASRLENEKSAVAKDAARAARRLRYFQLARSIRRPTAAMEFWPFAVLLVGPLVIGIVTLIVVQLVTGSYPLAFFAFLLSIVAGVGLFAALMYVPSDAQLPAVISDAEAKSRLEGARLTEKNERLAELNERLKRLIEERRDQIASGKLQRAALLQRAWKSMRAAEWEDFVVEVCRTHGAKVDRTGRVGGEDVNLIADFGNRRVALFTEGEGHNVASSTIQQAIAAKDRHGCQSCAVIINRRFTGAAQDFANRNGCKAIGAAEFPDFVLGKIEL